MAAGIQRDRDGLARIGANALAFENELNGVTAPMGIGIREATSHIQTTSMQGRVSARKGIGAICPFPGNQIRYEPTWGIPDVIREEAAGR